MGESTKKWEIFRRGGGIKNNCDTGAKNGVGHKKGGTKNFGAKGFGGGSKKRNRFKKIYSTPPRILYDHSLR